MADNLAVTPGSGATIRTKDNSGVHLQGVTIFDSTGTTPINLDASGKMVISDSSAGDTEALLRELLVVNKKQLLILQTLANVTISDGDVETLYT